MYNENGSVDVIVDVVGYFTPTEQPSTTTGAPTTTGVPTTTGAPSAPLGHEHASDDLVDEPGVAFSYTTHSPNFSLTSSNAILGSVRIRPPADGWVTVHADIIWYGKNNAGLDVAGCQITKGTTYAAVEPYLRLHDFGGNSALWNATSSAHRTFPVAVADNSDSPTLGIGQDFNVVCAELAGDVWVVSASVTAQFFPTSYQSVPPD